MDGWVLPLLGFLFLCLQLPLSNDLYCKVLGRPHAAQHGLLFCNVISGYCATVLTFLGLVRNLYFDFHVVNHIEMLISMLLSYIFVSKYARLKVR